MSQKREVVTAKMKHMRALPTGSDRMIKHYANSFVQFAVVVTLALSIMAAPASATEADATHRSDAAVQAQGEAGASVGGIQGLVVSIDQRLKGIQDRLASIEARLSALEAKISARGEHESNADATVGGDVNADAQADVSANAGADVTHNVETGAETGAKAGARVEHTVEKNGNTLVDFVIGGLFGHSSDAEVSVDGDLEAENQVMVTVTHDGEIAPNASVYANGELVGHTDTSGQVELTVPDAERLRIVVKSDEFRTRATYDVQTETRVRAEHSSTMEEESSADGDASADAEADSDADADSDSSTSSDEDADAESNGSAEGSASVHASARIDVS